MTKDTKYHVSKTTVQTDEAGIVLLFTAFLTLAIFTMVALSFEGTMASASQEQARHNAKLVALAAIEAYMSADEDLDEDGDVDEDDRITAAHLRANEVAQLNRMVGDASQESNNIELSYDANPTADVAITPGVWFYTNAADDPNPPCEAPCFNPIPPGATANAFRVSGALYDSVPAKFSRVIGFSSIADLEVDAVATLVPRQGCFLVDLSASMTRETHFSDSLSGAQFAFELNDPGHLEQWNAMVSSYQYRGRRPYVPGEHYQSDYLFFSLWTDSSYAASSRFAEHHPNPYVYPQYSTNTDSFSFGYRLDIYREDEDGGYRGPEPLTTVFEGLNGAIRKFQERRVTGDKACIIFYDSGVAWPRIITLTDNFDYALEMTDFQPYSVTVDLGMGTGTFLDQTRGLGLMAKHGLFPRANSTTDTRLAIETAMTQFANFSGLDEGVPVSNFLVLIGDGLSNCQTCPADGCDTDRCSNNAYNYATSMQQLKQFTEDNLVPNNVTTHIIMVGNHVAPHTLNIDDGNGDCLNDSQARAQETNFVQGDSSDGSTDYNLDNPGNWSDDFLNMSPDSPFFEANEHMYDIARMTGGVWGPLRPAGTTNCGTCDLDEPRRLNDPLCENKIQQMDRYMDRIIGDNPYQIVRER